MNGSAGQRRPSAGRETLRLVIFLAITFGAAAFGAQFMPGPWYAEIAKPAWTPPSWVFGPVWTILYVMIALSAWLVWRAQPRFGVPIGLWCAQLALNTIWSWLFFGLERPDLAAGDIVVLLGTIVATAYAFAGMSRTAALLLLPYGLWVGFATALNIAIWRLNA
jgi:tryptophan-rich sensory protein